MARRMGFSVIGLPHYTIWHLYEPSVDDLKHMEEMDHEREARERDEEEATQHAERVQSLFRDSKPQWEIDGAAVHDAMQKEQQVSKEVEGQRGSDESHAAEPEPVKAVKSDERQ